MGDVIPNAMVIIDDGIVRVFMDSYKICDKQDYAKTYKRIDIMYTAPPPLNNAHHKSFSLCLDIMNVWKNVSYEISFLFFCSFIMEYTCVFYFCHINLVLLCYFG